MEYTVLYTSGTKCLSCTLAFCGINSHMLSTRLRHSPSTPGVFLTKFKTGGANCNKINHIIFKYIVYILQ